jgi:hypothetical protein
MPGRLHYGWRNGKQTADSAGFLRNCRWRVGMGTFVGLIVAILAFAAVVLCMVYFADFEKATGYPRRRAFYILLAILLVAVILLIILYEMGVISSGLS